MTLRPDLNASSAWAAPLAYVRFSFHVEASPIWAGKMVCPVAPRT